MGEGERGVAKATKQSFPGVFKLLFENFLVAPAVIVPARSLHALKGRLFANRKGRKETRRAGKRDARPSRTRKSMRKRRQSGRVSGILEGN